MYQGQDGTSGIGVPSTPGFYATQPVVGGVEAKPKKKKFLVIFGVVLVLLFVGLYLFFFFRKTNTASERIKINFASLFNESSLIPYSQGGKYGYIDPSTKEIVIREKYVEAERFYGSFGKVKTEGGKYQIIDRDANVKVESDDVIEYELYGDIWIAAENIYDANMSKINPDGTRAGYIGEGYMRVLPDNGVAYLSDLKGKEYYKCTDSWCSFLIVKNTSGDYAIVKDDKNKIINIKSGKTLYESSKDNYSLLSSNSGKVIVEKPKGENEGETSYLTIQNDNVNKSSERPNIENETKAYSVEACNNGFFQIKKSNDDAVSDCKYDGDLKMPEIVELKLESEDITALLLKEEGKTVLFDVKGKKVIRSFDGDRIDYSDESPFVVVYSTEGIKVCNLLSDTSCQTIQRRSEVQLFSNYFVVDGTVYNYKLEKMQ